MDFVARLTVVLPRKNGLHEALGTMIQLINMRILVLGGLHFFAFLVLGPAAAQEVDVSKAAKPNANAFSSRALFLTALGQYEKAVVDFGVAISLKNNSAGVFQQRATAYNILGDLDKAIEDFSKAMELSPNFITAIMGRGYIYFQQGAHEEAIADYNKAIELTPDYALAYQNRTWLLAVCKDEKLRDPKLAIESATKACELNQLNDLSDMAALAAAHAALQEFDKASAFKRKLWKEHLSLKSLLPKKFLSCIATRKLSTQT